MSESLRLYLDQMIRSEVAVALRNEGYDVLRTTETGQARADDWQVSRKLLKKIESLLPLMNILVTGLFFLLTNILE